jgi:hypothetical protein
MPTATHDEPVLKPGDKIGRLPVDEDPADFLPDPEKRMNAVMHVPSCNLARGYKKPSGPKQDWPARIEYTVKVGDNVTHGWAFLHNGLYWEETSGTVYVVHPATFERLTGREGIIPPSAVPAGREVTISLQQQLDATRAATAAMQDALEAAQAEIALLKGSRSKNSA